ncbi:MAG: hypothetical protein ABI579_08500, partial [Candidatus Sumerlaeota bacterium]
MRCRKGVYVLQGLTSSVKPDINSIGIQLHGWSSSLLAAASPPAAPVSPVVSFLWDPVVIGMMFFALVMLLVLLAIRMGYYHRLTQTHSKVIKSLADMTRPATPEKPKPLPAVV